MVLHRSTKYSTGSYYILALVSTYLQIQYLSQSGTVPHESLHITFITHDTYMYILWQVYVQMEMYTYMYMCYTCMHNICLPNMRLQMAFLAILMFWNDPRMWILLH